MARRAVERYGRIDILVNNAGISGPIGPLQDNNIEDWIATVNVNLTGTFLVKVNVNLTGTFLVCRAVIPAMLEQEGGRIINLSGAGVANAWSNMSAYCASKAAVVRMTEVLAQELEDKGIYVNALGPGSVHTSMWEAMTDQAAEAGADFIHQLGQRVLSGGGASIDDCAELAVWLASGESGTLTGSWNSAGTDMVQGGASALDGESQTASELIRLARIAHYDKGDDKACARFLWEATFCSIQQLASKMGHPCEDRDQAEKFTWFLEHEHGGKVLNATSMLDFGLTMLDHAEDGWYSQEPEYAWTSSEFPLAIREVTRIAQSLSAFAESVQS